MKRQIRRGVFETNSSSVHSIVISKAPASMGKSIHFGIGEFGWENDEADTADYLYTAILCQDNHKEYLEKLKNFLDKNNVQYSFEEPKWYKGDEDEWLEEGYVDHSYELGEFLNTVLNDDDMLTRYLFGGSRVYTGNDNQDSRPSGCNIADEYIWVKDEHGNYVDQPNPYHDPEHYDYFYKGN